MKKILVMIACLPLLGACTASDVLKKVGLASDAADQYTAGQVDAKQKNRAKRREVINAAVNDLIAQKKYKEAIDFLDDNKPYLGQVLLDAKELRLKIRRLELQIEKLGKK